MLITITTEYRPATDLGYLLEKHSDKLQSFDLAFGRAHVFYPEASEERCTVALLLDLDPIGLVRRRRGGGDSTLEAYLNDRPYVSSAFMSVAIAHVFGSALLGRSKERPLLAQQKIPLTAAISVLRCRGGEVLLRRLFEPLDYQVASTGRLLDPAFPDWGMSPYFSVQLRGVQRLSDLLAHLYVLIPVLDADKHYFIGHDEVEKLLARGQAWLPTHPERGLVVARYLKHKRTLARDALDRLRGDEELDPDATDDEHDREEEVVEDRIGLNEWRIAAVMAELKASGARTVIDLGCGEGKLLRRLCRDRELTRIVGVDVSPRMLERAYEKLKFEGMSEQLRSHIELIQGALTYRDERFSGFDFACALEVIEHVDLDRMPAFRRAVFAGARPKTVIITTPNVEYNVRFENLPAGRLRHRDHRFEWTRREFGAWSANVAQEFGYRVRLVPIGGEDPVVGAPGQMAVFSL